MRRFFFLLLVLVGTAGVLSSACRSLPPQGVAEAVPHVLGSQPSLGEKTIPVGGSAGVALSPSLTGPLEPTTTEHFEMLHEPGASYAELAGRTLEYAYQHFYDVFTRAGFDLSRPQERLTWICFPQKSAFNRYALQIEGMDLSWLDGYYSTLTNRVAIVQADQPGRRSEEPPLSNGSVPVAVAANRSPHEDVLPLSAVGPRFDVTRLTHEVAHQLSFNSGIQKRGVMYPLWVSEGLATNFEFSDTADPGLDHANAPRLNGLLQAYAAGELTPLREFVVQTTVPPDVNVSRRYYAQAWGFFHFLLTEHPENLRAYLRRLALDRPNRHDVKATLAEFVKSFGPLSTVESSWNAFLARQAQPVATDR